MHEEDLEVPDLRPDGLVPGDLALEHHGVRVHVVEVRALGQQEHAPARPQALLLVQDALLQDEVALHEAVVLVGAHLLLQSLSALLLGQVHDVAAAAAAGCGGAAAAVGGRRGVGRQSCCGVLQLQNQTSIEIMRSSCCVAMLILFNLPRALSQIIYFCHLNKLKVK